jgi:hypothetical protein
MKHCPICNQDLPVSDFGRNAYYDLKGAKDGRNLYCKKCSSDKVSLRRRQMKQSKVEREQRVVARYWGEVEPVVIRPVPKVKLTPVEKVRKAIRNGSRTQAEIALKTKLCKDVIGEALAELLLWNREIRSEIAGTARLYFIVEKPEPLEVPKRKSEVLAPFHELQMFMPGRKRAVG